MPGYAGRVTCMGLQECAAPPRGRADRPREGGLGIHYRGVQWEGGAVDGGSIT